VFSPPVWCAGRELAEPPATRYNRGMIETMLPRAPELWATVPAPDHGPLLNQVATPRQENAALRPQNSALQERVRDMEAWLGQNSRESPWWLQTPRSGEAARRVSAPAGMEGAVRLHGT